ncbi:SAP domain-containing protein [Pseudobutyrivibrio sp. MD2005]|uniref:SAP domain-containing protein n=1 Tax=Pseudobutyrivibrio sp. MD2005 TaxID=1410616 RepID=UPI002E8DF544|nr:SAP domain-containing protein [Pseudobutyrivibrio sp. MD2005]
MFCFYDNESVIIKVMNKMTQRPILNTNLDSETFRSYYYLKEELVEFCRDNGIPTAGGKIELTDRIAYFLDTESVKKVTRNMKNTIEVGLITEDTIIE